jgi:hypothetical protein
MFMSFLPRFRREDGGYGRTEQGRDDHGMAAAGAWMMWPRSVILTFEESAAGRGFGMDERQSIHLRLY